MLTHGKPPSQVTFFFLQKSTRGPKRFKTPSNGGHAMHSLVIKSGFNLEELNQVLRSQVDPYILQWDKQAYFPGEIFLTFHELGLIPLSIPTLLGGKSAPMIDLLTVVEKLAYHS